MRGADREQTGLRELFLEAAMSTSGWRTALLALADATGSEHGQLIGFGAAHSVPFNWVTDAPEQALEEFIAIDGGSPDVNPRVAAALQKPPMALVTEAEIAAAGPGLKTSAYLDLASTYDIPHGCQITLVREGGIEVGMAVLRSARRRATSAEGLEVFQAAAIHAQAAARLQLALEHQGALLSAGLLESLSVAAFLCDSAGQVRAHSPAAETVLAAGALRLRQGRLEAAQADSDRRLQQALGQALAGGQSAQVMRTLLVVRGEELQPIVVEVIGLPRRLWAFNFMPCALVVVRRARGPEDLDVEIIAEALNLTRAEAGIARELACGASRDEIAAMRHVSPETVRTQIKTIFRKAEVNRVVELVARLHALQ